MWMRIVLLFILSLYISFPAGAESWRDKTALLVYSPRYFGANAFPLPVLTGGDLSDRWELELRGEYHTMPGDQTKDIFARVYVPIAQGRAGVVVSGVIQEWYKTSEAVRDERNAVETSSPIRCFGDVIVNCYYQVLRNKRWADVVVSVNLKTASGGRLCDARFTDAAAYWFTAEAGRMLWEDTSRSAWVRLQGLAGFYCWMTNDLIHRQNDAFCYGIGLSGCFKGLSLSWDCSGIRGYKGNGDRPIVLRSTLSYEIKKNILSFGYKHGIQDYLYDSFSLAYTRCF
nr:hypothetical protein [Parabacteroides sp. ZJ-118]